MFCGQVHDLQLTSETYATRTRHYSDLEHRVGVQLAGSPGNCQPPRARREPRPLCREHGCPLARAARRRARRAQVFSLGGFCVRWRGAAGLARPLRLLAPDLTAVRFEHTAPTESAFTAATRAARRPQSALRTGRHLDFSADRHGRNARAYAEQAARCGRLLLHRRFRRAVAAPRRNAKERALDRRDERRHLRARSATGRALFTRRQEGGNLPLWGQPESVYEGKRP